MTTISIHAPRTGSDGGWKKLYGKEAEFQSTLPARGATTRRLFPIIFDGISIHAPRTGSDGQQQYQYEKTIFISIHAPRTGSDTSCISYCPAKN